jgi:hypothetical protein
VSFPPGDTGGISEITFGAEVSGEVIINRRAERPAGVPEVSPPRVAIQYLGINTQPPTPNGPPAVIRFQVTEAQLDESNLDPNEVVLEHFNEETDEWERLPMTAVDTDGDVLIFEAETSGFSTFAITSLERQTGTQPPATEPPATEPPATEPLNTEAVSTEAPETQPPGDQQTPSGDGGDDGGGLSIALIAIIIIAILALAVTVFVYSDVNQ